MQGLEEEENAELGTKRKHAFKDVYHVEVEDVQVFVEKQRNLFNFHLLDPSLDIPHNDNGIEKEEERGMMMELETIPSRDNTDYSLQEVSAEDGLAEKKANEIVTSMIVAPRGSSIPSR